MIWQPDTGDIVIAWHDGRWNIGNVIRIELDDCHEIVACDIFNLVSETMFTAVVQNIYSVHDHNPNVAQP